MIHIRIDDLEVNGEPTEAVMACGLKSPLPAGDVYYFDDEAAAYLRSDCHGCNPNGPQQLGTPISKLSGRPGHAGYDAFCEIARSWGYD
jgi:hypothetical protein